MKGRFGQDKIAEVRERASLVEIVSRYTSVKRSGRNFMALCPFHGEKTPSFSVNEEKGFFYCFGCQVSGDVFKFLMLKENMAFTEAVERLAQELGIELPRRPEETREAEGRERLLSVNAFVARTFEETLWSDAAGAAARRYLEKRGIREETARLFGLGYAPQQGLAAAIERARLPLEDAETLGLVGRSTRGGWYDRFRGRLMFPIHDLGGRVVAFGGRLLEPVEDQPKYLNSPESPLFHKRRSLFGLARARDAIHRADRVLVVEGYLDVLSLVQAEIENVVAPLGTALTAEQIRQLRRFTESIVVFLDGDAAGRAAAARSFAVFAEVGCFADGAFLPEGEDPDSYVRRTGREGIERCLEEAAPLVDHYLRSLVARDAPLAARHRAGESVATLLGTVQSGVFAGLLARHAAEYLGFSEETLHRRPQRPSRPAAASQEPAPTATSPAPPVLPPTEAMILELLLVSPPLIASLPPDCEQRLRHPDARTLLARIRAQGGALDAGQLLDEMPASSRERLARALFLGETQLYPEPARMLRESLQRLEAAVLENEIQGLNQEIKDAERRGDTDAVSELQRRKMALQRRPTASGAEP